MPQPAGIAGVDNPRFVSYFISSVARVEDLLSALSVAGIARPAALRAELRVSPPTLAHLVAEAGETVFRIGKTRATRYARTRLLEGLGRQLPIYRVDTEGVVHATGQLRLLWGHRTFWERGGGGRLFEGLPPALVDMSPQGYLGRAFSARFPELRLPPSISDWSDDNRLVALAMRGEDCVGDLIVGDESLNRFMKQVQNDIEPEAYPRLARRSAIEAAGSSAGGERPKFGTLSQGRHVLVKYAAQAESGAIRRWRDLLWCEWKALETVTAAGRAASPAKCMDIEGWRFFEVERFDRVGVRGRRAVLSLSALNNEYFGSPSSWTAAIPFLQQKPFSLSSEDASRVRWLDVFGQLIGNTDRHFGNLTFFVSGDGALRLAPAYDMLPMTLAPSGDVVGTRPFAPASPTLATMDVWPEAARWAERYWRDVEAHDDLEVEVRRFAGSAAEAIAGLARQLGPQARAQEPSARRTPC